MPRNRKFTRVKETFYLDESPSFGDIDVKYHKDNNYGNGNGNADLVTSIVFTTNLRLFIHDATSSELASEMLEKLHSLEKLSPESLKATLESDVLPRCDKERGLLNSATALLVEHFDITDCKAVVLMGSVRNFCFMKRGQLCRPFIPLSVLTHKKNTSYAYEYHCKLINKYISEIRSSQQELKDRYVTCVFTDDNNLFSPYATLDICFPYANLLGYGNKLHQEAATRCSSKIYRMLFGSDDLQFLDEESLLYCLTDSNYVKKRLALNDACDSEDVEEKQFVSKHAYEIYQQFGLENKLRSGFYKPYFEPGNFKRLLKRLSLSKQQIRKGSQFLKTLSELAEVYYNDLLESANNGSGRFTCLNRPNNYCKLTKEEKIDCLLDMGFDKQYVSDIV